MSVNLKDQLHEAVATEAKKFEYCYLWLQKAMPKPFFQELSEEDILLITHSLMGFPLQEYYSSIRLKRAAIVLTLDDADADLRILKHYAMFGIKNYRTFVSYEPPPFPGLTESLRIAVIHFTEAIETGTTPFSPEKKEKILELVQERNPEVKEKKFDTIFSQMNQRFIGSLPMDRIVIALDMFFRTQECDHCKYDIQYNPEWEEQGDSDDVSMQIVLAWRNTPKHNFLYRLARIVHRNNLVMKRVNATYINPHGKDTTLIMALGLHGAKGEAAWDAADLPSFIRSLVTVKYFACFDRIDERLVKTGLVTHLMGNWARASVNFIHQCLVYSDPHLYTLEHIEEDLCAHPELITKACEAVRAKFCPNRCNLKRYEQLQTEILEDIRKLDTGQEETDIRRKIVLKQLLQFLKHTLKTNLYRYNYTALSFRLDPRYLDELPYDRKEKFPELPYAIFFIKGMHFIGFHIRFRNLARGGLRTVFPANIDLVEQESNQLFRECYNLAYTQHKKNKDIPESGAKGVILLNPYERLSSESSIVRKELEVSNVAHIEIEKRMAFYETAQKDSSIDQAQRSYIESLLALVNCDEEGNLKTKQILDYLKQKEYLYIGPDEHLKPHMIEWIAEFSRKSHYKPGTSFITSKPTSGINHKEYGVTSIGVHVYMQEVLKCLGIDPEKDSFTVKLSGGPDGDVAGNQICNLAKDFPNTAKITALTDGTGTIYDPEGLSFDVLIQLFQEGKGIRFYPPEKLSEKGFLVDKFTIQSPQDFVSHTLCWRNGKKEWLPGSEANHLLRHHLHEVKTDLFIPAGGRPRTLHADNIGEFFCSDGKPTSRGVIEGANLYFTQKARRELEKNGTLFIKDSSANKTGVICSSFEVLCGLVMSDQEFQEHKEIIVKEIIERIKHSAKQEAKLLISTYAEKECYLTEVSDELSDKINLYTDQLLAYLDKQDLAKTTRDPLINCYLSYSLPVLRQFFEKKLISEVPEFHKKAIIASHLASQLIYENGLSWEPGIVDIFPSICK